MRGRGACPVCGAASHEVFGHAHRRAHTRHTVDPKVIIDSGMRPKRPPTAMKMAGVLAIVAAVIVAVVVIVSQGAEGEL